MSMILLAILTCTPGTSQNPDPEAILSKADLLLEQAKQGYEDARSRGSVEVFVEAGFKLEASRIKYIVVQEIGSPAQQKTASERLRGVQQLTKLINDGRVALAKTPDTGSAQPPRPETPAAPNAPPPPPPPPEPAARPSTDVTKRPPPPDAAAQREAEKLLKDLFKDAYAKKDPAGKHALARLLIEQAAKSGDDLASVFVLYREASDAAVQGGDIATALLALDETARLFDVDGSALRNAAISAAAKNARFPQEFSALAEAQLRLIDEFMAMDQYDSAEKTAASAAQHAKRTASPALTARTTQRQKEIAEARSKFNSLKKVLESLAQSPEHPGANLEMGQFLCFVKGSWELGIRFLAKGSDPVLKALADKEISLPLQAGDRMTVADGWWDLAQKESSPLRKAQMTAHARALYEGLLPEATGLLRAKIEKRLSESLSGSASQTGPVELLGLIDPRTDAIEGTWTLSPGKLLSPMNKSARIQIPYLPSDEYDLTAQVTRIEGSGSFSLGIAAQGFQTTAQVDAYKPNVSGLCDVDGKTVDNNVTTTPGTLIRNGRLLTVTVSVRKEGITLTVDGRKICSWKGEFNRLSTPSWWAIPNRQAISIGSYEAVYAITKLQLTPIAPGGRRLR